MSGCELKQLADSAGLSLVDVLHESGIDSPKTVYKVYNDQPVRPKTKLKVEQAIKRLAARAAQTA